MVETSVSHHQRRLHALARISRELNSITPDKETNVGGPVNVESVQ